MNNEVLFPEINLIKQDEFYLFYEMMVQSLKTDDVKEGINKSFSLLRTFLNSGNISLYRKNSDNFYTFQISDSKMNDLTKPVGLIVNKTKDLAKQKSILKLNLNLSENINNVTLLNIIVDDCDYILAIINNDETKELESQFFERVKDTMQIILKRAISYEKNIAAISTDLLTGLDNRNSYEMRIQSINEADEDLVFGIFDLFRLKYINDNYNHLKGDLYIKSVAKILNKYWPKQKNIINDDLTESHIDTGHCIYRIGGDEFVLLTKIDSLSKALIKAELARKETSNIDLGIEDNLILGLNYGIVKHISGDYLKQTSIRAVEIMKEDKSKMYKKYQIDRRR